MFLLKFYQQQEHKNTRTQAYPDTDQQRRRTNFGRLWLNIEVVDTLPWRNPDVDLDVHHVLMVIGLESIVSMLPPIRTICGWCPSPLGPEPLTGFKLTCN